MLPDQRMVRGEVYCDVPMGGRIQVHFHWDRMGRNNGGLDYFVASELIRFYDNDDLPVAWEMERDNVSGTAGVDINCDGYVVDVPLAPIITGSAA